MILLADSEGPDQTARMRMLIWAFAVRRCLKTRFSMAWFLSYLHCSASSQQSNIPAEINNNTDDNNSNNKNSLIIIIMMMMIIMIIMYIINIIIIIMIKVDNNKNNNNI